jgi:hypothetical protein
MLWLVTSPAGSASERAAGAALRAAAADGWEVTAGLPWRSQGAGAAAAGSLPGFASPGAVVEQRSVELAFEHFSFRGELRRDEVEPGVERWWAVPRSPRLEPPLAAAFVAAAALEIARAERHAGLVLVGLPAALVPILLDTRLRAHPQFEDLRTYWVVDDLRAEGWIEGSVLAELGLPEGLRSAPFGDGGRVSALLAALHLSDGLLVPPARGIRDSLRAVAEGGTAEALVARRDDLLPFAWALDPVQDLPAEDAPQDRAAAKEAAQRLLGVPVDVRVPLVVAFDPSPAARTLIEEAVPAAERQRARVALIDAGSGLDAKARETVLRGADIQVSAEPWDAFGFGVAQGLRCGVLPVYFASSGAAHAAGSQGFPFRAFLASSLKRALGSALTTYRSAAEWRKLRTEAVAAGAEDPWPRALKRWRATWKEALGRPPRRVELPSPPPLGGTVRDPAPAAAPPQEVFIDWGPGLPERYQEDAIALLVQSPRSLYAYWDVCAESRARAGGYRLRLSEANAMAASGEDGVRSEQGVEVGEWGDFWIVVEPDRRYAVELTTATGEVLLRSAEARTPPEDRSPHARVSWWDPSGPIAEASRGTAAVGATGFEPARLETGRSESKRADAESRVGLRGSLPPGGVAPRVAPPGTAVAESRGGETPVGGSSEQTPRPPGSASP